MHHCVEKRVIREEGVKKKEIGRRSKKRKKRWLAGV